MLFSFLKTVARQRAEKRPESAVSAAAPTRLHIGGKVRHPDWKTVDVMPGANADYVASCTDLSLFPEGSVTEIYASHVVEHLSYQSELGIALREFQRVLIPGGVLRLSVPDLTTLCSLFLDATLTAAERFHVMRMMFGGQLDVSDFHHVGLYEEILTAYLAQAGFEQIERVAGFGLFEDSSSLVFKGRPVSLNVIARKSADTAAAAPAPQAD